MFIIGGGELEQDPKNFNFYSDVGKDKVYLGCGLPVIITKVLSFAFEIGKTNAGLLIDYDK